MRSTLAMMLALLLLSAPAATAAPSKKKQPEFTSSELILRWINNYRVKPEPARMPVAVKAASELGVFRDMDQAGIYVGFMAGVLQANPRHAEELIARCRRRTRWRSCVPSPTRSCPTGRTSC
jgi:hypothetical protein